MEMEKISVIIPVYKTEHTLDECMESVFCQNWTNYEVILVDDGSPDHSPDLCDRYAAEHEKVSVIHQANQGLAGARNTGMAAAKGTWITFLDSDDCLDGPDALRVMAERGAQKQADIVVGSFRRFYEKPSGEQGKCVKQERKTTEINHHHLRGGSYTGTTDFRFRGFYMYGHLAYNWGKLYRRAFLMEHELWVPLVPFTQDKAHNIACCANEPVYAFVDESVYLYRENEDSVTHRYKENMMPVWIAIAANFRDFLNERHITKSYGDLIAFHLFFGAFFLVQQELSQEKKRSGTDRRAGGIRASGKVLQEYGKDPLVRQSFAELARGKYTDEIESVSWKFVIRGAAILFSLHGYTLMAFGIACLGFLGADKRITRRRYRAAKKQPQEELLSQEEHMLLKLLQDALSGTPCKTEKADTVFHIARKHAVLPLLYDCLDEQGQIQARNTVLRSYHLLFMTKYVVSLLEEHQIPVVVLKGVSAAVDYPVPELREAGDVDLFFVGKKDAPGSHVPPRAELDEIMGNAGFCVADEQHANHHIVYTGPDGIHVELHYQAAEEFAYPGINEGMERWMGQSSEHCILREIMGLSFPVFDRPFQAFQLLLHMFQHFVYAGFGLKQLCDWTVLLREPWTGSEREQLAEMIRDCHLSRFAELVTEVCVSYLGLESWRADFLLPDGVQPEEMELFLREILDSEESGGPEKTRMVMMKGTGPADYIREFHHQMHLNYPRWGKNPLFWPALWVLTFARFVQNNRRLRHVRTFSVLRAAGERSRRMKKLHIFDK